MTQPTTLHTLRALPTHNPHVKCSATLLNAIDIVPEGGQGCAARRRVFGVQPSQKSQRLLDTLERTVEYYREFKRLIKALYAKFTSPHFETSSDE